MKRGYHRPLTGSDPESGTADSIRAYEFGAFTLDPATATLWRGDRALPLRPLAFDVLRHLVAQHGRLVSKNDLINAVWRGAAVGDDSVTQCIVEIRKALDDRTRSIVRTLPRRGFVFDLPVRIRDSARNAAQPRPADPDPVLPPPDNDQAGGISIPGRHRLLYVPVVAALALLAGLVLVEEFAWDASPAQANTSTATGSSSAVDSYDIYPLTSFVGREFEPALSPDGSRVAFVRDDDAGSAGDVHVKSVGSEAVLKLGASESDERHPAWSPDGRNVLFVRRERTGSSILQVSALGGGATVLMRDEQAADVRGLDVAPDGASVVYARRENIAAPYQVVVASLTTGEARPLTHPETGMLGDVDPLFARDGRAVYFARSVNETTKDLYSLPIEGGDPRRLTFDNRKINGLTWSPGGNALLFTSTRSGTYRVWEVDPDGGVPRLVSLGTEDVQQPSSAPDVGYIVYEQWMHRAQLRRIGLDDRAETEAADNARSTRWDANPAWSPDGDRIAFTSNRGGPQGIWVSERDGGSALKVAELAGAYVDHPAWSPDGEAIAFDASPDGRTAIYVVAADGGVPQRLTHGSGDSRNPAWSKDGEWLYFESNASGTWQVHAQAVRGGEPRRITTDGGVNPAESVDGQWLIYSKPDTPGLWRRPRLDWRDGTAVREEELLTTELEAQDHSNWAPASDGIYFVRRPASGPPVLSMLEPGSGAIAGIVELDADFQSLGLDLAPDESEIIFSRMLLSESDLRLAIPR